MSDASGTAHAELLAKVELFARLDRVTLARLAAYLEPVTLEGGATVCRQGDPGDALYIVTRGRFGVFASSPDGAGETRLGSLSPVEAFGEMALLTDEPRSATVRAEGSGEVLRLDRTRFLDLLRREPAVALAIAATLSRRLRARDRTIVESDQAVAQIVEQGLGKLSPERRLRVFEASILDELSIPALQALFGQDAGALGRDLSGFGIGNVLSSGSVQPSAALLRMLRERFEQEVGAARMQAFAQEAGLRLAEAQRWEDALGVLARGTARPAFLTVLGRALRGVPPIAGERAMRWVERVTDEEAAQDPEVALARAALHEARGDPGGAAHLLRRALGSALVARDSTSSQRLTAGVARLAAASGGSEAGGLGYGLRAAEVQRRRPRAGVLVGVIAAAGLTSAAIGVGSANPQVVFVLLLAAAIVLWVTEVFPDFAVSLGLMAAWILWGIARPAQAAAGFASMNWFFVLSVLGIAAAVARSGLLFRVGLLLVHRMRRGLFWQAAALLLTGVVLSPILPQNKGRAALTGPLALAVAEASRLRDREPAAALLGLAAWIGAGPMMFLFLNGSALTLLAWGLLPEASRTRFDWIHWLGATAPLGVFLSIGALAALFLVFRPRQASAPTGERVAVQLAVLGPPSAREWAMIAVLGLTVAGWIAAPALRVDAGTVAVLGLFASVAAGCFDRRAFQELDWNYLIFYGVALSIAVLTVSLGLDRVVAGAVGARLTQIGVSPLLFVLGVACLNFLVQLVLSQNQSILLLGLALIPTAPTVGVDPWVVIVTLLATSSMWFLPAQTTSYLVAYSATEGRLYSHAQARRMSVAYAAVTLAGLALSVPYWRLIGLL